MKRFLQAFLLLGVLVCLNSCGGGGGDEVEYLPVQTSEGGAWKFINSKGEIVGNQEWEFQPSVTKGGIFSVLTDNDICVYKWDGKEAKPIDSLQNLVSVGVYNEGLLPVTPNMERIRVVNNKGDVKFVLEPIDGNEITACSEQVKDGMLIITNIEGKYGAVNDKGEVVVKPQYDEISDFNEGFALAVNYNDYEDGPTYYILDKKGEVKKVNGKFGYEEGECATVPSFQNGRAIVAGENDSEDYEYHPVVINTSGEVEKMPEGEGYIEYLPSGGKIINKYSDDSVEYTWEDKEGKVIKKTEGWENSIGAQGKFVYVNGDKKITVYTDEGKELWSGKGNYWLMYAGGKFGPILSKTNENYEQEGYIILNEKGEVVETPKLYNVGTMETPSMPEEEEYACGMMVTSAYVDVTAAASKLASMVTGGVQGKSSYFVGESVKNVLEGENINYLSGKTISIPTKEGSYYLATGAGFYITGNIVATANVVAPTYKEYFEVHHYDWRGVAWGWKRKKQTGVHINPAANIAYFDIILHTNHASGNALKEALARRLKKEGYTQVETADNYEVFSNNYSEAIVYGTAQSNGIGVLIGDSKNLKLTADEKSKLAVQI